MIYDKFHGVFCNGSPHDGTGYFYVLHFDDGHIEVLEHCNFGGNDAWVALSPADFSPVELDVDEHEWADYNINVTLISGQLIRNVNED
jgi:hypothetical protein